MNTGLNAGDLDREIVLQRAMRTQDPETGEAVLTWPTSERVWAQWLPGSTREVFQAQQRLESYIDGIFRIYWRPDIGAATHRILWDGKVFDVKPPMEIGRRDGLDIPVVARAD